VENVLYFDDLITELVPPPNRVGFCEGALEQHLYEGAVMLAYAMRLLDTKLTNEVCIFPDGEHGKQFDFSGWLGRQGFSRNRLSGKTSYGGTYTDGEGRTIIINPKSGQGDVVAKTGNQIVSAECKGGIINTRHPGQVSRLDKGLCEAVGRLMATKPPVPDRQVAVVPYTATTFELAKRLASRCARVGIKLALVKGDGQVKDVQAE
jgi:hypothetical protein